MTKQFCDRCKHEISDSKSVAAVFWTGVAKEICHDCRQSFDAVAEAWFNRIPTDEERLRTALSVDNLLYQTFKKLKEDFYKLSETLRMQDVTVIERSPGTSKHKNS